MSSPTATLAEVEAAIEQFRSTTDNLLGLARQLIAVRGREMATADMVAHMMCQPPDRVRVVAAILLVDQAAREVTR